MNFRIAITLLAALFFLSAATHALVTAPEIVSAKSRVVRVKVPAGFESVTLQHRVARRGQPWETLAVSKAKAIGDRIVFRIKKPIPRRMLRVLGTRPGQVPSNFLTGISDFLPPEGAPSQNISLGTTTSLSGGGLALDSGAVTSVAKASDGDAAPRSVVESDIWKLSGDRLYLYNQYRGLHVLDVAEPAKPALLGTLSLPASGEALYELADGHVALLANRPYVLGWDVNQPAGAESSVLICDTKAGTPALVANLPVSGQILESRLVGTALYVASSVPDNATNAWYYRTKIQITGFDLSGPANPVVRNTVTLRTPEGDGYTYFGAVQASSHFFMVAENSYRWDISDTRSTVSLVDISNPNGTVTLRGRVALEGFVQDKFKLREEGGILSTISFYQGWWNSTRRSHTRLDNFDLSSPDSPKALGNLELGLGEQVHGTRFDGDRVYVVTFFRIDPLWIVDNSDPAAPIIASELEVPGFSTYLAPLGDRLVTVGFLDGKVTVSLFNVADAKNPTLLTQLPVTEHGAWSEATWDEKAFTVLPEAGLIMLPVSAGRWSWWGGSINPADPSGIQLVDLGTDSLTLRGRIPHGFAPRRATVHEGSVLAFSQDSLLTADITDRDAPVVTNDLQLAWRTDHVWHIGSHLVQIGGGIGEAGSVISVSKDNSPDDTLSSFDLGRDRIIASDVRNGYLYVVQQEITPPNVETFAPPSATLRIFDLTSLPRIINVGTVRTDRINIASYGATSIVWPQDGTLVLVSGGKDGWSYPIYAMNDVATLGRTASTLMVADRAFMPWYYPTNTVRNFDQFDVTAAKAPAYVGRETIKPKGWGQFSAPVASNGKVFITRFVNGVSYYPYYRAIPLIALEDKIETKNDEPPVEENDAFVNRHALHVLDYTSAGVVKVSEPVGSPGELIGLRNDGKILYTRGYDYDSRGQGLWGSSVVHASAFDGQKLHLITTLPHSGGEALPIADKLFTIDWKPVSDAKNEYANFAALWRLDDDGKFKLLDEEKYAGYNNHAFGDVILSQKYDGYGSALTALDISNPAEIKNLGSYHLPGWLWVNPATADGTRAEGFWFPLGNYGVLKVELPK